MIAAVIRSALVDEALQAGLRTRLEEMRQRLARLEERGAKKRQLALDAMCEVGLKKLEQPDFTASARAGLPPLVIVADDVIPEPYWVPQPPKLDRQSLLADLKRGEVIPGAQLGNPKPTLRCEDQVMAFSEAQVKSLEAKLDSKHVRTRRVQDTTLAYVEGWHVIAEANRIFGYDAWDRHTLSTRCVWSGSANHHYAAAYIAKVRIAVRAGAIIITREGCGSGNAKAPTPGEAHELALKAAETDATKRALATFGNPFGLALYDRELAGVKNRKALSVCAPEDYRGPWLLSLPGGAGQSFDRADEFIAALSKALTEATGHRAIVRHLGAQCRDGARNQQANQPLHAARCHCPKSRCAFEESRHRPGKTRDRANAQSSPESQLARAIQRIQKLIRVSSPSVSQSVFAQKSTFASSPSSHASSAAVPQPTPIISATRNREGLHSK